MHPITHPPRTYNRPRQELGQAWPVTQWIKQKRDKDSGYVTASGLFQDRPIKGRHAMLTPVPPFRSEIWTITGDHKQEEDYGR